MENTTTATTGQALKFTHNAYVYGKADSFRIGYSAYRVWTTAGYYQESIARNEFEGKPFMASLELYAEEMKRRGQGFAGASSGGSFIDNAPADVKAARRAKFEALPELHWGDVVELDGVRYTVRPASGGTNRDHVEFVKENA